MFFHVFLHIILLIVPWLLIFGIQIWELSCMESTLDSIDYQQIITHWKTLFPSQTLAFMCFLTFLMIQCRFSSIQIHLSLRQMKSNLVFFTPQCRAQSWMHIWTAMGVRHASMSLGIKLPVMWTATWSSYCLLIQRHWSELCPQTPHKLSLTIWHQAAPTRPLFTPGVVISATRSMWPPQPVCRTETDQTSYIQRFCEWIHGLLFWYESKMIKHLEVN